MRHWLLSDACMQMSRQTKDVFKRHSNSPPAKSTEAGGNRAVRVRSEYVAVVQRFSETRSAFEAGAVAHALAAAMRDLVADWHLFVTQLEHQMRIGKLTLQVSKSPSHHSTHHVLACAADCC